MRLEKGNKFSIYLEALVAEHKYMGVHNDMKGGGWYWCKCEHNISHGNTPGLAFALMDECGGASVGQDYFTLSSAWEETSNHQGHLQNRARV